MITSPAIFNDAANYVDARCDVGLVLRGWRASLMAHELLSPDGHPKDDTTLAPIRLEKRQQLRLDMQEGIPLAKPVLGIGWTDGVEIASGSDVFVLLALEGAKTIDVHVRKSALKKLKPLLQD